MAVISWIAHSVVTVLDTGLNSLGSATGALSSAIDNDANQAVCGDFELFISAWGGGGGAFAPVDLYLVRTDDGTNYEDGSTAAIVARDGYVGSFPWNPATGDHRFILRGVRLPPRDFKVLLVNNSGIGFPASGNTLKLLPYGMQAA